MKYAVGAIILTAAAVLAVASRYFDPRTVAMLAFAMGIVTLTGGAPVLFSVLSRRSARTREVGDIHTIPDEARTSQDP